MGGFLPDFDTRFDLKSIHMSLKGVLCPALESRFLPMNIIFSFFSEIIKDYESNFRERVRLPKFFIIWCELESKVWYSLVTVKNIYNSVVYRSICPRFLHNNLFEVNSDHT